MSWLDEKHDLQNTISDMMTKIMQGKEYNPTAGILHHHEGVDLLPSSNDLFDMEIGLVITMNREIILKSCLETLKDKYDYILIDCSPSLSMMTLNALSAADSIIIPVQAQYLPAKCMTQLLQTVAKVKRSINPNLKIDGVLLTLVDNRTNLAKSTIEALQHNFGNYMRIFKTLIPVAVKTAEVTSKGKSIHEYDSNSTVAKAYTELAKEVLSDDKKKERLHSTELR